MLGLERLLVFIPSREVYATPAEVGVVYRDVTLLTSDKVQLHGWYVAKEDATSTLLWCHGNAGNIADRLDNLRALHLHTNANILLFDYRGYGRSRGSPSEKGTYLDADAALSYLLAQPEIASLPIVYFGRSLGSAVALELAVRRPSAGLILETPFSSIRDMAGALFPRLPIGSMLRIQYNSLQRIPNLSVPLLVIHGDQDDVVPYEQGVRLFSAAPEPKSFYRIPGARHNDTYIVGGTHYFQTVRTFLDQVAVRHQIS